MANTQNATEFITVEQTSASGEKFQVGYPKQEGDTEKSLKETVLTAGSYKDVKITPYNGSYLSQGALDIGVKGAYIEVGGTIYKYRVWFYNSKGWGFRFKDETGDTYKCSTVRNGWHYIDYNSSKPTMIGVKAD